MLEIKGHIAEWDEIARQRAIRARANKLHDCRLDLNRSTRSNFTIDQEGAWGEGALHLLLPGSTWHRRADGTPDAGVDIVTDAGVSIDAKATRWPRGHLREWDKRSDISVLAIVDILHCTVELAGWANWDDWKKKSHETPLGKSIVRCIAYGDLRSMKTLPAGTGPRSYR